MSKVGREGVSEGLPVMKVDIFSVNIDTSRFKNMFNVSSMNMPLCNMKAHLKTL